MRRIPDRIEPEEGRGMSVKEWKWNRRTVDNCGLSTDLLTLSTKMGYGSVENASDKSHIM